MADRPIGSVKVCIHQGAATVGGNCIELISSSGERLLLDAGRPLEIPEILSAPIPPSLDISSPVAGIVLSHAHSDHCGMLASLPASWPVYCGAATGRLLHLFAAVRGKKIRQPCVFWTTGKTVSIGSFSVTPYLIDHSAFDAHAVSIEADGRHIFYSGDFRSQGRKGILTQALMRQPPRPIDVLVMEGTNLTAGPLIKPTPTERSLEEACVRLFRKTEGRIFVSCSSANIDRLVTLYRACKKSGRILAVDLFCALLLLRLREFGHIPQPDWQGGHMRTVVTRRMANLIKRMGEEEIIGYLKSCGVAISARKLADQPHKWVIATRESLIADFRKKGIATTDRDCWVWSMWSGYLHQDAARESREFFAPCHKESLHTSGHASPELLKAFAKALQPEILLPVHGESWLAWKEHFPNLRPAANGEWLKLSEHKGEPAAVKRIGGHQLADLNKCGF